MMEELAEIVVTHPWLSDRRLQAALLALVAIVASHLADRVLSGVIKAWAQRTRTSFDDRLLAMSHTPVRVGVLVAGLALATHRLALPPAPARLTHGVLATVAILVWLVFALRFLSLVLEAASGSQRISFVDGRTFPLFNNVVRAATLAFGIYFLFLAWDIDVAGWLAGAGIVGITLGLAAKDTLANLFSGVFISADAPYQVGDFIVLDTGERGRVTQIGIRSTRLLTRDDIEITIPNAVIANSKIINESGGPWAKERIRIRMGVAYGSDIDQVKEVLLEVAVAHEQICDEPAPRVRFRAFGESSLDLELLAWIDEPVLRGRTVDALLTEIYKRFQREGIEIPFPQRVVHLVPPPAPPGGTPAPS